MNYQRKISYCCTTESQNLLSTRGSIQLAALIALTGVNEGLDGNKLTIFTRFNGLIRKFRVSFRNEVVVLVFVFYPLSSSLIYFVMSEEEFTPNGYSTGTCMTMCPKKEALMREKENLLHKFEIMTGTENLKRPRADPEKVVKCYSRSAAGNKINSSDLRPFDVLMKTIKHLFHSVFPNHSNSPLLVYDFMFDRMRAIRQDMVVQNLSLVQTISILEPITRFHIYFGYILAGEDQTKFDPYINNTHLQECLKRLLVCYDNCQNTDDIVEQLNNMKIDNHFKNRRDIEGAYLLFNLPHFEALTRGAKLSNTFIDEELVKMSFAWYLKNYVRVLNSFKRLSPLLLCVASSYIVEIRKYSLYALCYAFNSSNSSYPLSHLKELLLYETESQVINDCCQLNIKIKGNNVNFLKKDLDPSGELSKFKRLSWIDEKLKNCDIVKLLCYGF